MKLRQRDELECGSSRSQSSSGRWLGRPHDGESGIQGDRRLIATTHARGPLESAPRQRRSSLSPLRGGANDWIRLGPQWLYVAGNVAQVASVAPFCRLSSRSRCRDRPPGGLPTSGIGALLQAKTLGCTFTMSPRCWIEGIYLRSNSSHSAHHSPGLLLNGLWRPLSGDAYLLHRGDGDGLRWDTSPEELLNHRLLHLYFYLCTLSTFSHRFIIRITAGHRHCCQLWCILGSTHTAYTPLQEQADKRPKSRWLNATHLNHPPREGNK